jgi:hypothetical protein
MCQYYSRKEIVQTLKDVFGAERSRDKKSRKIIFEPSKLQRLSKIYDLSVEVQVVTHMTHVTHVGLDKHLEEQNEGEEIAISNQENTNILNKNTEDNEKSASGEDGKCAEPSIDVSQASVTLAVDSLPSRHRWLKDCSIFRLARAS